MSNYPISNHELSYNAAFDVLYVTNTDDNVVVDYDLTTAHELKEVDGNYVITNSSVPSSGWHSQKFKSSEQDTLSVQQTDHLGVSDLRVERRASFTYHLDKSAVLLKYDGDGLLVFSPCLGNCSQPIAAYCTVVEL